MSDCAELAILLVDYDSVFRQALADNLRIDGHEVYEYPGATGALQAIESQPCSALVTEYIVPGANGLYLADRFRALRSGPTVVVTAHAAGTIEAQLGTRRYVHLLPKPVEYDRLHAVLHHLVEGVGVS